MGNGGKKGSLEEAVEKQREQIKEGMFGDEEGDEKYQDALDYVYGLFEAEIRNEYLVNGAILSCEKATNKMLIIDGVTFLGKQAKTRLKVNRKGKRKIKEKSAGADCGNLQISDVAGRQMGKNA